MKFVPIKKAILWSLCLFFLICCQEEDEQANYLATPATISETLWRLRYIESASGGLQIPPDEFRETLYIYFNSDTTFSAGSPCNAGGGKYAATREGSIQVKVLGTTYMLCEDRRMEWEGRFFDALRKVERYVVEEDRLLLFGESLLVFRQGIPPEQPDCFDFEGVQIDTDPCISAQCKITEQFPQQSEVVIRRYVYTYNDLCMPVEVKVSSDLCTVGSVQYLYDCES